MIISQNIAGIQKELKLYPRASLLVVTKLRTSDEMTEVFQSHVLKIGENRVQEMVQKLHYIPSEIERHMIGHLQKNKVKKAVGIFDIIESVDSLSLAEKISEESNTLQKTIPIFLQVNISHEPQKGGFFPEEILDAYKKIEQLSSIKICGIMCIPKFTNDQHEARSYFSDMFQLYKNIIHNFYLDEQKFELSMGMSHDYKIALEEGATLVRIGRRIFEENM
ncbi:YggS family pyridoxal phosphate-dependent enzyme [Candidatus Peregrinibacteria bacterium]|nr:YggS family pyridoxal phosphate-dependent enzyme [Candidatus Peregrinibacteria bacterium]